MTRICFISQTAQVDRPLDDPSTRYRCYHPAEVLEGQGHACHVTSLTAFLRAPQFDHDLYIFHRPEGSEPQLPELLARLHSLGRQVRADYDDLIFGEREITLQTPFVRSRGKDPDRIIARYRANLDVLTLFDQVTVSTEPLRDQVLAHHPDARVEVQPNFIAPSLLERAEEAGWYKRERPVRRIGYFAGTKGHSRDFRVAERALRHCLAREPDTRLLIVGPVDLPWRLHWHRRVERQPLVPYEEMFELMSRCTDVIAPLEDTVFNRCKSRVKYLEAVLAGCRLVATPVPDMKAVANDWMLLPRNAGEWQNALEDWGKQELSGAVGTQQFNYSSGERITGFDRLRVADLFRLGQQ